MYPIHPIGRPVTGLTDLAAIRQDALADDPHHPDVESTEPAWRLPVPTSLSLVPQLE
jgi:hypothetical protein